MATVNSAGNNARIPSKLRDFISSPNLCSQIKSEKLVNIGSQVIQNTIHDDGSRREWVRQMQSAVKLAKQFKEVKNYPWPKAASVKYPLVLTACVQYNARTNPEMIKGDQAVFVDVMQPDPTGELEALAKRQAAHMSFQLLQMSHHWREDLDKLLMILPLTGSVFKKTYWDDLNQMPESELCLPDDVIINIRTPSLNEASRITHVLYYSSNDLIEKMRMGFFTKIPLEELGDSPADEDDNLSINPDTIYAEEENESEEENNIHVLYEQHTYLDLDEDGYSEPYIITVHKATEKVLRIVARYDESSFIFYEDKPEFIRIEPIQHFTHYRFIPSPDGDFYGLGFGRILMPLNETVNTIINQLLDAGTLANGAGGFIGRGVRMQKEVLDFKPGEWKRVETNGMDLKSNIVPLPVSPPSPVLFQLLELLLQGGQEISAVSDTMIGQQPAPNTPATTVQNLLEQGQKVFDSIQLRVYESMKKEFEKLYEMNKKYLSGTQYFKNSVASGQIMPDDYRMPEAESFAIFPVADPNLGSEAKRIAQSQLLMNLMQLPGVNQYEVVKRFLEVREVPNIDKVLTPPDPNAPPPPEVLKTMAEIDKIKSETSHNQMKGHEIIMQKDLDALQLDMEERRLKIEAEIAASQIASSKINSMNTLAQLELTGQQQLIDQSLKQEEKISSLAESEIYADPYGSDIKQRIQEAETLLGVQSGIGPSLNQAPQNAGASLSGAIEGAPTSSGQGGPIMMNPQSEEASPQEPEG